MCLMGFYSINVLSPFFPDVCIPTVIYIRERYSVPRRNI